MNTPIHRTASLVALGVVLVRDVRGPSRGQEPKRRLAAVMLRSDGALVGGIAVSGAAATADRACTSAGLQSAGFDEV